MYQKHEIVIRKNTKLMERYEELREKAYEMSDDDGDKLLKDNFSYEELQTVERIYASEEFLSVEVSYYTELLNLLSQFNYKPTESIVYGCPEENNRPYASCKVEQNETDDEIRVVIEEFWNNRFELQCTNHLTADGLSLSADYSEVPKIVRLLYNATQKHDYLQKQYAENREAFGDCMSYNCTGRYFDECANGEGAVGVFNHDTNQYEMYGYGGAEYGWGAKSMTDNLVDKSFLQDNPDKIWYPTNPKAMWFALDDEENNVDTLADMCEAIFKDFPEKINDLINEDTDNGAYYEDGTEIPYVYELFYLWREDIYNGTSEQAELIERCHAAMTGREVLALIECLENANKVFMKTQDRICGKTGKDYKDYINKSFFNQLLFCSDDNEILYADTDSFDENGLKTGDIVLHYKNFIQG